MPVYFIRAGEDGPVKIGIADDVADRMRNLQCGNHLELTLLRTIDGGRPEELALHRRYEHLRSRGEWFAFTPDMLVVEPADIVSDLRIKSGGAIGIIDEWPSMAVMSEQTGAPHAVILKWRQRNSIPSKWWRAVIAGAERAGIQSVTYQRLSDAAA
jgi:hypothetical protein